MIVVADTSPLNYLALIGEIELLPALYDGVLIPQQVHLELQRPKTPAIVRAWAADLPPWCEVRALTSLPDNELNLLDAGERDAIQLALENAIDVLLVDDIAARIAAARRHLTVTGTLSVLEAASQAGLVDFRAAFARLQQTSFRISPALREAFLLRNP